MTKEKKKAPAPARGTGALARKAKFARAKDYDDRIWRSLNPLKEPPKIKHKSYFESVENTERKKKLEFQITTDRLPPPGFEFIPTGHPELTQACKDLSRDRDAMIFIVSDAADPDNLDHHMYRAGYHFRQMIVDDARETLRTAGHHREAEAAAPQPGCPEPIPENQHDIDKEADAVLRDLFPRIPNTDRHDIITHAFQKDGKFHGDYKVGMAKNLTLARRVQLAALAHIRHTRTRYDALLKETDWANARKAVEKPCLDVIVKWRGDEETGRDQLDEILREVVEISDSEDDSEDDSSKSPDGSATPRDVPLAAALPRATCAPAEPLVAHAQAQVRRRSIASPRTPLRSKVTRSERRKAKKAAHAAQRFRRYAAAAESFTGDPVAQGVLSTEGSREHSLVPVTVDLTSSPSAYGPARTNHDHTSRVFQPSMQGLQRQVETYTQPLRVVAQHPGERYYRDSRAPAQLQTRGLSPIPIRMVENQRPKVGSPLANNGQHVFQDMLLASIEPPSPSVLQATHDPNVHHQSDAWRYDDSRVAYQPSAPSHAPPQRLRSPPAMGFEDREHKRTRVVTYFPEDYHPADGRPRVQAEPATSQPWIASQAPAYISYSDRQAHPIGEVQYPIMTRKAASSARDEVLYDSRVNSHFVDAPSQHRPEQRPARVYSTSDEYRLRPGMIDGSVPHETVRVDTRRAPDTAWAQYRQHGDRRHIPSDPVPMVQFRDREPTASHVNYESDRVAHALPEHPPQYRQNRGPLPAQDSIPSFGAVEIPSERRRDIQYLTRQPYPVGVQTLSSRGPHAEYVNTSTQPAQASRIQDDSRRLHEMNPMEYDPRCPAYPEHLPVPSGSSRFIKLNENEPVWID